jgi:hypothetical protein
VSTSAAMDDDPEPARSHTTELDDRDVLLVLEGVRQADRVPLGHCLAPSFGRRLSSLAHQFPPIGEALVGVVLEQLRDPVER